MLAEMVRTLQERRTSAGSKAGDQGRAEARREKFKGLFAKPPN